MKNYIAPGNTLVITASSDIGSGDGVLAGGIFGVASGDIANGDAGIINLFGVFELPKAGSQAWTVGAKVYWDDGNSEATTDDNTGANPLIGIAYEAVAGGAGDTLGKVRLNGTAA